MIGLEEINKRIFGHSFIERLGRSLFTHRFLSQLEALIVKAQKLGLPETDIENALIDIEYNESPLAFELIVEQMYEHEIKIDEEFYKMVMAICVTLKIDRQKYDFLKELMEK